jgi:ABC-type antimicrobial peptide transport system permease subunit
MALGASASRIRAAVVSEGLKLTLAGAALGSVAFAFTLRFLRSLLFDVSASDGSVWILTVAAVAAVAAAACAGPSLRATAIAPAEALRRD